MHIDTKDAEEQIKRLNEGATLLGKTMSSLIPATKEATEAMKEYQNIADKFVLKEIEYKFEEEHEEDT